MPVKKQVKKTKLRRVLGVAFGISIVIGGTIGAGILRVPGSIAALLPDARLIIGCWIVLGLFIMLSASSYAELTTMLPKAGGAYNYIRRAFGNYAGFINGWFDFICNAIAPAYFCIVLSEYIVLVFPQLHGYNTVVAISELTVLMLINFPGVKSGSIVQQVTSGIKIILFIALIIACFLKGSLQHSIFDSAQNHLIKGGLIFSIFKTMQLIMGTYDGWMAVSFFAEEDNNASKNIPRSYLYGAFSVSLLYIFINAAILYVLPVSSIAGSPLAASQAAAIAFGKNGGIFMTLISIFSLISILNAYIMIPPRILFGLSRDGYFVKQGTVVNRGGTPIYSSLFCYVLALVLIVFSSFDMLFSLGAFMMTIVTGFAFASLIRLRKKEPGLPRPYKAWGYPFTTYLAVAVSIALFIGFSISDQKSFFIILTVVILSVPCYKYIIKTRKVAITTDEEIIDAVGN